MEPRPILNQFAAATPVSPAPGDAAGEERLATHLPIWDLVPPHALLVRRRAVHAPAAPPSPVHTPARSPSPVYTSAAAASPPQVRPPAVSAQPVSSRACQQCNEPLEDGAAFCSECGASQS
jgi:hypothetical protein